MAISMSDLLSLSVAERLQLVEDLWDSIADSPEIPLTEEQRQEIDRRLAEHDRNPESAIPWEEARARLLRRIA
jgi:putative addiction module component (TIGR02574 family)